MKETPSKHIFSKHDNRHAFPGSATYFESGLGRRRIDGSLPSTQNLIDWMPLKEELQRERPLVSSYQSDFRSTEKPPQLLVHHAHLEKRPLQRTPSTTYQHTYRSYYLCEPSLRVLKSHQLIKEDKPKEPESAPATSSEPTAPIHSKSSAPASSEPTATDANATAEALAPGPTYGHSVPYKTPRWTVSDCLNWNNC